MVMHIAYHGNIYNKNMFMLQNGFKTDKILLLLSLNRTREHNRAQIRENSAVIARIQYTRRKRRACFFVFCESDRLSTTVAGQRFLGQTKGKFILVYD